MKAYGIPLLLLVSCFCAVAHAQAGSNFAFDIEVNDTYVVTPSYGSGAFGDLPDGEIGLPYDGARVCLVEPADFSTYQFQGFLVNTTNPWPVSITYPTSGSRRYWVGIPSNSAGTYYMWIQARWFNTATSASTGSTLQGYRMEVRPNGYGITYPPPPGGGGGGSDSSCSTVAGVSYTLPSALTAIFGALFWRRRRKSRA